MNVVETVRCFSRFGQVLGHAMQPDAAHSGFGSWMTRD